MGGKIGLESVSSQGSTFWIELTLAMSSRKVAPPSAEIAGTRILIIDHHQTSREITRELLQSWGCEAEAVSSWHEANDRLNQGNRQGDLNCLLFDHDTMLVNDGRFLNTLQDDGPFHEPRSF